MKLLYRHYRVRRVIYVVGGAIATSLSSLTLLISSSFAQLVPDTSLGQESSIVTPATVRGGPASLIEGGASRGSNLFHSFSEFNVHTGQRVYFANPAVIENILTRITGGSLSSIDGLLGVDGAANLFLLNPNGVIFGPNARLDISGSFLTSTGSSFTFADGSVFSAVPTGNEVLTVSVPLGVQFNARPQGDIRHGGNLAVGAGETLTLFGATVTNSGNLTAPGGTVQVLGDGVTLAGQAVVDVSSATGGGTVLIGGDYQGRETVPTAQQTVVEAGVQIAANALESGGGGTVIVWADDTTDFAGSIAARGGPQGGDGGFVETSGRNQLTVRETAQVDAGAFDGAAGTWLLDPTDLTVVGAGGTAEIAGGTNSPTTAGSINAATVVTALNGANVNLQATNSISVNAAIDASGNASGGNLILTAPTTNLNQRITLFTGSTLTGTANTVSVGAAGSVHNGVDAAATGGTVNLAAATYREQNEVAINRSMTINGAGAGSTIVSGDRNADGTGDHRVFNISGAGTVANINNLTITEGNTSGRGGGLLIRDTVNFTLTNSVVANNTNTGSGGGIAIVDSPTVAIENSTISNNRSISGGASDVIRGNGGGLDLLGAANVTIRNSTFSGNVAGTDGSGGGLSMGIEPGGSVRLIQSTVTNNDAGAGIGGINAGGNLSLSNSIVAGNDGGDIVEGQFTNNGNNLIGGNPLLAPLDNYGGSTPTHALLPGSPAIDAARGPEATTTDQRGFSAAGIRDIGAYEFLSSLRVDNPIDEIDNNFASGNLSLREAIQSIGSGGNITFAPDLANGTITTALGEFVITRSMTIDGIAASNLTISGDNKNRVFNVSGAGTVANINNLIITQGLAEIAPGNGVNGGGIYNNGSRLTVSNSTIRNSFARGVGGTLGGGGGLYNDNGGELTVRNSIIENNTAAGESGGGGSGGGIYNVNGSRLIVDSSTIRNNTADGSSGNNGGLGGGIVNFTGNGRVTVTNSTISGNTVKSGNGSFSRGGGIHSESGDLIINNSTISNNRSEGNDNSGGGIYNAEGSRLAVTNSIFAGNIAPVGSEINSLNTGNSNGNNLFGVSGNSGVSGLTLAASDIVPTVSLSQILTPLGSYGGSTPTHALLPGSPAIDAGSGTGVDQRGVAIVNDRRDIGAFESRGFTLTASGGTPQTTNFGEAFANPLTATVTSPFGEPVAGGVVTFTAPTTGASATLSSPTAIIGTNGEASVTATANNTLDSYIVTASIPSVAQPGEFKLTNDLLNRLLITVSTLLDSDDNTLGFGEFSLREALRLVGAGGTIQFDPSLAGGTIDVVSDLPAINNNLTIQGLANRPIINTASTPLTIGGNATTITLADLIVAGNINWNGGTNDLTLNGPNSQLGTLSFTGNNVTVQESAATDLGASTVTGNLTVTSSGAITDSGNLSAAGTATLNAGGNNITLDSENNQFGSLELRGNNIQFGGDLTITDSLFVGSQGTITQNSGRLIVGGPASLRTSLANAGNVSLRHNGILSLSGAQVGGDLNISATDILRRGPVQVAGETAVNSTILDFNTTVQLIGNNTYSVFGFGNLDLSRVPGLPSVINGNLEVSASTNSTAFVTNFSDTNAISLPQPQNSFAGGVTVITPLPPTTGAPPAITQSAPLTVSGSVTLNAQTDGIISLNSDNNRFGNLSLTGNTVSLRENDLAVLENATVGGNLAIAARDVEIGPNVSVGDNLSLQPYDSSQNVNIGRDTPGTFSLSPADIDNVNQASPASITVGGDNSSGNFDWRINSPDPFESPTTVQSPRGRVTVSAPGPFSLEEVTIYAKDIELNANGNITLHNTQLLGSLTAGSTITINTGLTQTAVRDLILKGEGRIEAPFGFVTIFADRLNAIDARDSDIVAGLVTIRSTFNQLESEVTLQNISRQNQQTDNNDIISTGFEQDPSGFDPSQGTLELNAGLEDASDRIQPGCGLGNTEDSGEFVVTGRGGLPPNPSDLIVAEGVNVPWVVPDEGAPVAQVFEPEAPAAPLVEAQGIGIDAEGNSYFVAEVPGGTGANPATLATQTCAVSARP